MAPGDPYERKHKRLLELFNEAETPESSEDPYADDGEYGSDKDYYPSGDESLSSDDAAGRRPQKHASNSSGESSSSSDSDDSDKTFCPSEDERRNEKFSYPKPSCFGGDVIWHSFTVKRSACKSR
ncbi:unnamed protein product, partial [Brenthis ino]